MKLPIFYCQETLLKQCKTCIHNRKSVPINEIKSKLKRKTKLDLRIATLEDMSEFIYYVKCDCECLMYSEKNEEKINKIYGL